MKPLPEYLREAWQANESGYRPPAYGQPYRTPMFEFVRAARAHPELATLDGIDAADQVEAVLRQWHNGKQNPWARTFPQSEDPQAEFVETWERVKWPKPELEMALQDARCLPLAPTRSYSPQYAQFVAFAGHLQRRSDGRPIFLPCRKVASVLGCTLTSVSRYRRMALKDGLMTTTAKYLHTDRKADEFRFHCEQFDWETGTQITSGNLNICVTPESRAEEKSENVGKNLARTAEMLHRLSETQILRNSDTQETQETQDIQENQETQETQENQEPVSQPKPATIAALSDEELTANRVRLKQQAEELKTKFLGSKSFESSYPIPEK